jgi:hypothetical protein
MEFGVKAHHGKHTAQVTGKRFSCYRRQEGTLGFKCMGGGYYSQADILLKQRSGSKKKVHYKAKKKGN